MRAKRRLLELALRPFRCPVGTFVSVVGLAGIPDDLDAWQRAFDDVTRDERVLALAEQGVNFAHWVNQPVVRVALLAIGITLLLWHLPWFWRLRHRIIFIGRHLLSEDVWISRTAALDILRNSTWAQIKKPIVGFADNIGLAWNGGSLTHNQRLEKKFHLFIGLTLDSFAENNPSAFRTGDDGSPEYEEGSLRRFTLAAIRDEVIADFGEIPSASV